ncbi:MAG: hypothetical protein ACMUIE_09925 [Thermoplasmatota archaeon]
MEGTSFKVSAEVLQKNAAKASIRDLNAEFQMKGGKVIYKTSKKGDTYLLTHPDEAYLEEFRLRLFRELGLIEEKDVPKEIAEPRAPPPRYGDKHQMRRGWNVRSPREFKEGRYNKEDFRKPEGRGYVSYQEKDAQRPQGREQDKPRRWGGERDRRFDGQDRRPHPPREYPREPPYVEEPAGTDDEDSGKSFEERWGDIGGFMEIIRSALQTGAVDDGQIIKHAYQMDLDEERIKTLKKLLWDNRCRGPRENCPHGKKKLRFEEMMKVCAGKVEGWENIDSPFIEFLDMWKKNMKDMFGDFRDRPVEVKGKISSFKPVYRKGHEHLKILVYDTMIKDLEKGGEPRETRKLWVKVALKEFHNILGDRKVHLDDIIAFKGTCIYDKYFHDYWVVDLTEMDVLEEGGGEIINPPQT